MAHYYIKGSNPDSGAFLSCLILHNSSLEDKYEANLMQVQLLVIRSRIK